MQNEITVMAVGDLMCSRSVLKCLNGGDRTYPFHGIGHVLNEADVVFGNLETPLTDKFTFHYERGFPKFAAPAHFANRLAVAGFNVVSLANNHILDQGVEGLEDTMDALKANRINFVGIIPNSVVEQDPVVVRKNGISIGFLGYAGSHLASVDHPGSAPAYFKRILAEVRRLRREVDVIVVSLHHGFEYSPLPGIRIYSLIRLLLVNGVDIILGHHPHVMQGLVMSGQRVAFCSLGNCVSDMGCANVKEVSLKRATSQGNPFVRRYYEEVKRGLLVRITIRKDEGRVKIKHKLHQIRITEKCAPQLVREVSSKELCRPSWMNTFGIEVLYRVSGYASRLQNGFKRSMKA